MIGWPVFPTSPALAGALPDAIEYGALGSLIGHEYGHGLDTRESRFDDPLVLGTGGWSPADRQALANRSHCLVRLHNSFPLSVDGTTGANITTGLGASTLNENLADYVGIRAAYRALTAARDRGAPRRDNDGRVWAGGMAATSPALAGAFTDEQLFFVAAARVFCVPPAASMVVRPSRAHASFAHRVRRTMGQAPAFAAAFQCPPGAPYHPPPADRCEVYYGFTMTRRAGAGVPGAKAITEAPKLTVRQYRELSSTAATTPTRSRTIGLGGRGRPRRFRLVLRLPCTSHPSRALLGTRF